LDDEQVHCLAMASFLRRPMWDLWSI